MKCVFLWVSVATAATLAFLPREFLCPLVVLFGGIVLGLLLIAALAPLDAGFLSRVFLGAYLGRIVLAFILYLACVSVTSRYPSIQNGFFVGDGYAFSHNGAWIAEQRARGHEPSEREIQQISMSKTVTRFDFWNAAVYAVSGKSPFSMFFLSALAGSLVVVWVYLITALLWDRRSARCAALLSAFWPSHFLWGSQNLKEPFTLFLIGLSFWTFLSLRSRFRFHLFFLCLAAVLSVLLFQTSLGVILLVSFFLDLLITSKQGRLLLAAILLFVFVLIQSASFSLRFPTERFLKEATYQSPTSTIKSYNVSEFLKHVNAVRSARTGDARTAFLEKAEFETAGDLYVFTPLALFYVFFSPFPWMVGNPIQIFGVLESLLFYFFVASAIRGFLVLFKTRGEKVMSLSLFVGFMVLALGIIEGNVGTLFRHRSHFWILIFVFIAVGLSVKKRSLGARWERSG